MLEKAVGEIINFQGIPVSAGQLPLPSSTERESCTQYFISSQIMEYKVTLILHFFITSFFFKAVVDELEAKKSRNIKKFKRRGRVEKTDEEIFYAINILLKSMYLQKTHWQLLKDLPFQMGKYPER